MAQGQHGWAEWVAMTTGKQVQDRQWGLGRPQLGGTVPDPYPWASVWAKPLCPLRRKQRVRAEWRSQWTGCDSPRKVKLPSGSPSHSILSLGSCNSSCHFTPRVWGGNSSVLLRCPKDAALFLVAFSKSCPGPLRNTCQTPRLRVVFLQGLSLIDSIVKKVHQATFSLSAVTFASSLVLISPLPAVSSSHGT